MYYYMQYGITFDNALAIAFSWTTNKSCSGQWSRISDLDLRDLLRPGARRLTPRQRTEQPRSFCRRRVEPPGATIPGGPRLSSNRDRAFEAACRVL